MPVLNDDDGAAQALVAWSSTTNVTDVCGGDDEDSLRSTTLLSGRSDAAMQRDAVTAGRAPAGTHVARCAKLSTWPSAVYSSHFPGARSMRIDGKPQNCSSSQMAGSSSYLTCLTKARSHSGAAEAGKALTSDAGKLHTATPSLLPFLSWRPSPHSASLRAPFLADPSQQRLYLPKVPKVGKLCTSLLSTVCGIPPLVFRFFVRGQLRRPDKLEQQTGQRTSLMIWTIVRPGPGQATRLFVKHPSKSWLTATLSPSRALLLSRCETGWRNRAYHRPSLSPECCKEPSDGCHSGQLGLATLPGRGYRHAQALNSVSQPLGTQAVRHVATALASTFMEATLRKAAREAYLL